MCQRAGAVGRLSGGKARGDLAAAGGGGWMRGNGLRTIAHMMGRCLWAGISRNNTVATGAWGRLVKRSALARELRT